MVYSDQMNDEPHFNTRSGPEKRSEEKRSDVRAEGRMATVLQILPNLGSGGGVERGTVEIAEAIVETGGRAIVVSAGGAKVHELQRVNAEHIELPVNSKNPFVMYANIQRLVDVIKREGVDIIHARSRAPAWSAYFAARRASIPFITTFHGTYGLGWLPKRKYNSVMTLGDRVITISNFIAGHVRRVYGVPNKKIRIIHRGVDISRFDPKKVSAERVVNLANAWRLTDGHPVIMLPGRLTRWKGQVEFIEAVAKLGRRDIRCLLVGGDQGREDYRRQLERLVDRNGLGEVVRIVDHCDDMPAAYMLSDLVVSASTEPEAFGRVIVEGQALGRLVIASNHGGAQETVIEGETGWLVPPMNSEALAEAMKAALSLTENERNAFSEKCIANVRENFSKEVMCAKTLDVYNEVLAPHVKE
jgi:glycosyltransferase involved in cell wall biosynthesis